VSGPPEGGHYVQLIFLISHTVRAHCPPSKMERLDEAARLSESCLLSP
jgi:hypothetical protein